MIADYIAQESAGHGTAAPTDGSYTAGDIVYNDEPALDGYVGWVCTESGKPGVWEGFGTIGSTGGTISGGVTGVTGTAPIVAAGTNAPTLPATGIVTLSMANQGGAGFAPGFYQNANVTADIHGLVTAISAGNGFGIGGLTTDLSSGGNTTSGQHRGGFVLGSGAEAMTVNWLSTARAWSGQGISTVTTYGPGVSDSHDTFHEFIIPYADTLWGDDKVPWCMASNSGSHTATVPNDRIFNSNALAAYAYLTLEIGHAFRGLTNEQPYSRVAVDGPGSDLAMDTAVPTGSNTTRGVACDYSGTYAVEPTGITVRARGFYDPSIPGVNSGEAAEARYMLQGLSWFCIGGPPAT